MHEELRRLAAAYDPLAAGVLLLERRQDGWGCAYRNPAAEAFLRGGEEELLLLAAPEIERAAAGETGLVWRGELRGRRMFMPLSPHEGGRCMALLWDGTDELRRQQERMDAANAALKSALDAANAASKAKTDFLSSMSHDIRTPLNAIIGMTTIAQAHAQDRDRVDDCLKKIELSSRHLLALINDILDMSRIESGKMSLSPEAFTMADFIHALMAVLRPQADKKWQKVDLDFSGVIHEQVRGDQLRMQQIMINILSNAVKFTPPEGTISMRVRETGERSKGEHNYAYYEFVIADTGIGMGPEALSRLFSPFERAREVNRVEGTGLGMAITRNLVEMMNGEISVESEEGKGTRFTVTLPLEQLSGGEDELTELRGLRVLVADGDAAARQNTARILSDLGMTCDLCENALSAYELAGRARMEGNDYFAILLSWHLPVVDGVAASRELRAMLGDGTPILVMSSWEWTLSGDEMRAAGISAFVPKPLFRTRLGKALCEYTPEGMARRNRANAQAQDDFSGCHLLLVEDNEINREIGVELLEMLGATVECAEDGKQALDRFAACPPGTFDLIFMDLQMAVMDGYEATRAIRALPREDAKRVPIVAMSANAFVEDIRACERAGMNAHVPKPASVQSLADVMRRFLAGERKGARG